MSGAMEDQKSALDALALESQMVDWVVGAETGSSTKATHALNY